MDRWLSLLPKGLLAFTVIGIGIIVIIVYSPPHTVCESQIDIFRQAQARFLFLDPKRPLLTTTKYRKLIDQCKITNDPGGCYELFNETRTMLHDMQAIPSECLNVVGDIAEVKTALWEIETLLVRLAWGEKPPPTYNQKFGWLDTADVSLYCLLKQAISDAFGEDSWEPFRERLSLSLPGADKMSRSEIWDMSLFSENCTRYP